MNKRQQKKIAKQQILSSLQSKGITEKQARKSYATDYAHKNTSSLTEIAKRQHSEITSINQLKDNLKSSVNYYNSIINQLRIQVNSLDSWRSFYLNEYNVDIKELGLVQWLDTSNLEQLHIGIENLKEELTGNKYIDNVQKAITNVGDTHNVYQLIHKYMAEEMETTIKPSAVIQHVRNRFELMAEEYFFDSDQIRQEQAIQAIGAKTFTENPIDPSLYNK